MLVRYQCVERLQRAAWTLLALLLLFAPTLACARLASPAKDFCLSGPARSGTVAGVGAPGIGGLLATRQGGVVMHALSDLRGNVAGLVDCGGVPTFNPRYGAFGPLATPTLNAPSFATRWLDPTGFYYFGGRYYDAANGRFLSPDPSRFADSRNLYAYCGNDPVNNCDPDGMLEAQLARETRKQNTRGSKLWDLEFGGDADVQFDAALDLVASVAMLAIDLPAVGGLGELKAGSTMARMGAGVESGLSVANLARELGSTARAVGSDASFATVAAKSELLGPAGPGQFVLRSGQGSLETAGVVRRGTEVNRVFDSRWQLGRPYSQPMGGSFSPGAALPSSASQAIIGRGLNYSPNIMNNAEAGAVYRAIQNIPATFRTSLGGIDPEIMILEQYQSSLQRVGDIVPISR